MYIIFSDLDWGVVLVLISIFMVIIFLNESLILVRFIVNMVGIILKIKINDYLYLKNFYLWIELCMYIFVIILVCLSYYIYVLVLVICCVDDM